MSCGGDGDGEVLAMARISMVGLERPSFTVSRHRCVMVVAVREIILRERPVFDGLAILGFLGGLGEQISHPFPSERVLLDARQAQHRSSFEGMMKC